MWPNRDLSSREFWKSDWLLWVSIGTIHVSPAAASMALGMFVLQTLFMGETSQSTHLQRWGFGLMSLIILWDIASLWDSASFGGFTRDFPTDLTAEALRSLSMGKVLLKLPLFAVFLLYAVGKRLNTVAFSHWPLLVMPLLWTSVSSVIHYWQHRSFYDQMVLESKPIPLYSQVYHIEYAVLMGLVVLLMVFGLFNGKIASKTSRNGLIMSLSVLVICMHVLGTRTGLVLIYTGGLWMALWTTLKNRIGVLRGIGSYASNARLFAALVVLMIALLVSAPSLQNRWQNTLSDLKTTQQGGDVTHQSFGQRWVAWNTSIKLIGDHKLWFSGYGIGADEALKDAYRKDQVGLAERHRIGFHNQWLEGAVQSGWVWMLLLFVLGFLVIQDPQGRFINLGSGLWIGLVVAMMFESLLERQAGVLIAISLFQGLGTEKNNNNSEILTRDALNDEIK